jgi:hypothetical protein
VAGQGTFLVPDVYEPRYDLIQADYVDACADSRLVVASATLQTKADVLRLELQIPGNYTLMRITDDELCMTSKK